MKLALRILSTLFLQASCLLPLPLMGQVVREENIHFVVQGDTLAGTVTFPSTPGRHPAVVLLSGGTADNRDEQMGNFRPFKILADSLASIGLVVFRYDDRGVAESGGRHTWQYTVDDHAAEPVSAMSYLKSRSEVEPNRIGLLGHSYGTMIAARAAQLGAKPSFVVLLSPPGLPWEQMQSGFQRRLALLGGKSASDADDAFDFEVKYYGKAVRGEMDWKTLEGLMRQRVAPSWSLLPDSEKTQYGSFDKYFADTFYAFSLEFGQTPWMRSFWDADPRPMYERINAPVLLVFGGNDLLCPPDVCAPGLQQALERGANRDVTLRVIPQGNHNLRNSQAAPGQFAQGVVSMISKWLLARL